MSSRAAIVTGFGHDGIRIRDRQIVGDPLDTARLDAIEGERVAVLPESDLDAIADRLDRLEKRVGAWVRSDVNAIRALLGCS